MLARIREQWERWFPPHVPENEERSLPPDLQQRVRRIEITTRRWIDQGVAGAYHSVFRGRGVEFREVRPYQPGDDVRAIDWNRTARMGQPYVKQFVEERDLKVVLALDISGSLQCGSRAVLKRELAAEVAALLAFSALRNQDQVGAALLSDRLELFLPPRRRRTQVLRLVDEVLTRRARGGTNLELSLNGLLNNLPQRTVLFLISDLLAPIPENSLKRARTRHDLVVFEVLDPRDLEPPATAPVVLEDAETGELALVDSRKRAAQWSHDLQSWRQEWRSRLDELGIDWVTLRTDRAYLPELVRFFRQRQQRRRQS